MLAWALESVETWGRQASSLGMMVLLDSMIKREQQSFWVDGDYFRRDPCYPEIFACWGQGHPKFTYTSDCFPEVRLCRSGASTSGSLWLSRLGIRTNGCDHLYIDEGLVQDPSSSKIRSTTSTSFLLTSDVLGALAAAHNASQSKALACNTAFGAALMFPWSVILPTQHMLFNNQSLRLRPKVSTEQTN